MSSTLKIDFCSYEAAKFACENWHYSKCTPVGKLVKFGVWENNEFIGAVIFGYGANNNSCKYFNMTQDQVCELVRVALKNHTIQVSKILSICLKLLKRFCPKLKIVFSYSDLTNKNHIGIIYQASNFIYLGSRKTSDKGAYYIVNGKKMHGRSVRAKWGSDKNIPFPWRHAPSETKHLYVYLLDRTIKLKTMKYPKRAISKDIVASANHAEEGGETPTIALQSLKEKSESVING